MTDLFAFLPIVQLTLPGVPHPQRLLLQATELVEHGLEDRRPHYVRGWLRADRWAGDGLSSLGELSDARIEVEVAFVVTPQGVTLQAATPEMQDQHGWTSALPHAVGRPLAAAVLEAVARQLAPRP